MGLFKLKKTVLESQKSEPNYVEKDKVSGVQKPQ